jgi:cholesterol transport system auxiliary component
MRRPALRALFTTLLFAALAGCALAPAADPPITASLLDQLPGQVPHRTLGTNTLLVFAPEARPAIDTAQMAYSLRPHHLAYYAQNQWAETPPQMLQPLLVRTLEATGAFRAVVASPHTGPYALGLRTEMTELVQDFAQEPPVLRLSLRVRLNDGSANRVLATREITVKQPMQQKGPQGGVAAANAALAQALEQVAGFVLENTP